MLILYELLFETPILFYNIDTRSGLAQSLDLHDVNGTRSRHSDVRPFKLED